MTEAEWLTSGKVPPMLRFLGKKAGARKRRLFACACVRRLWGLLLDPRSRRAVEVGEAFDDGTVDKEVVKAAQRGAAAAARLASGGASGPHSWRPEDAAGNCALLSTEDISTAARAATAAAQAGAARSSEEEAQAALLRCVFGNPFRPAAADRRWLSPAVHSLASATYDDRLLPTGHLDPARLLVLADALEDGGCSDEVILTHLREPGPHVRGCWVLDLLLGRG
jgi:hypothetical protein